MRYEVRMEHEQRLQRTRDQGSFATARVTPATTGEHAAYFLKEQAGRKEATPWVER